MLIYIIVFVLGLIGGALFVTYGWTTHKYIGFLRVDFSNEDGPYMFLEAKKPIQDILTQKYVMLEVKIEDYIPQK